jgi:ABC-2 type transport system ATP-binding protein
MELPDVIQVDHVSKKFVVHKDKSLKERIVNAGRSKRFASEYWALQDISFAVHAGESLGLAGANGSGKSTLLKIIGGILTPDNGQVRVRGRIAALLELGAGFHPDLTGRENIQLNASILGLSDEEIADQMESIIDFSGIRDFIDTQVKFYSSGMYVRLAFAVAVHSNPDILLVDEVLAVGDEPFQRKCMEKIREFQAEGRSIILVSHSAQQIIDVCDRAIVLDHGHIIAAGEARDAMGLLHENYEEQIQKDMEREDAKRDAGGDDTGTQHVVITNVSAMNSPGISEGDREHFQSGDDLKLAVDLQLPWRIEGFGVKVKLVADNDVLAIGIDSKRLGLAFPEVSGALRVTVTLPRLNLNDGNYAINIAVVNSLEQELARKQRALVLVVTSDVELSGLLMTKPEISIGEIPFVPALDEH